MGQYYVVCNLDSKTRLTPSDYDDGLKLMELANSRYGVMSALAAALTVGHQGRGDWAGQRVVVAGDYADEGKFLPAECADVNLCQVAQWSPDYDKRAALHGYSPVAHEPAFLESVYGISLRPFQDRRLKRNAVVKVYPTAEELFTDYGVELYDDVACSIEDLFVELRIKGVPATVIWRTVERAEIQTHEAGSVLTIYLRSRDSGRIEAKQLNFPLKVTTFKQFLDIQKPRR